MSDSQRELVDYYGWTSFVGLMTYILLAFGTDALAYVLSFFRGVYSPNATMQSIDFSANQGTDGYIPQIRLDEFSFPLLACDVDSIPQGLIGWRDRSQSYDYHNMIFDVPYEASLS